jgi:hypothetical protein
MAVAADSQSEYVPVIFDDAAQCIVIGDSEYYWSENNPVETVLQFCLFLESQVCNLLLGYLN